MKKEMISDKILNISYESPKLGVIEIMIEGVLCASSLEQLGEGDDVM